MNILRRRPTEWLVADGRILSAEAFETHATSCDRRSGCQHVKLDHKVDQYSMLQTAILIGLGVLLVLCTWVGLVVWIVGAGVYGLLTGDTELLFPIMFLGILFGIVAAIGVMFWMMDAIGARVYNFIRDL